MLRLGGELYSFLLAVFDLNRRVFIAQRSCVNARKHFSQTVDIKMGAASAKSPPATGGCDVASFDILPSLSILGS